MILKPDDPTKQYVQVHWKIDDGMDHWEGDYWFLVPVDWDRAHFDQEIRNRAALHVKNEDWPDGYSLSWTDLISEVNLGPDITYLDLEAGIYCAVDHDEDLANIES